MLKLEQLKKPDLRVQIVEQRAAFDQTQFAKKSKIVDARRL
jgi:hypothetical protein